MTHIQNASQHIKGNFQQAVGTIEKKLGHSVQGTTDQIKGKTNVAVSNLKDKIEDLT